MADIHFAPSVALRVAECFDKIRVNPGNFGIQINHVTVCLVIESSDCGFIEVFCCS